MLRSKSILFLVAGVLIVAAGCGKKNPNESSNANQPNYMQGTENATNNPGHARGQQMLTIPASTELVVALDQTVETNTNQAGDVFGGHLARAVDIDGKTVIPEGSRVDLEITSLVKGGRLKTPPEIAFTVKDVVLPNGSSYPVSTSDYYDKGRSHTKREVGMIGGGAAAGAIIGGILGKTKGAVIGGAAGAAAGTGAAAATGRQNLVYSAGETFTFTVKEPLIVSSQSK